MCYLLAATSGLRRSELASLRWGNLDFDAGTATLKAAYAKNRKQVVQPLPAGTVAALAEYRGKAKDGDRLFRRIPSVTQLRKDLKSAGLPYKTEDGVSDFHSLRASYATCLWLGQAYRWSWRRSSCGIPIPNCPPGPTLSSTCTTASRQSLESTSAPDLGENLGGPPAFHCPKAHLLALPMTLVSRVLTSR